MPDNDKVKALVAKVSDEPAVKALKEQLYAANQAFEEHIHNLGDQLNISRSNQEQKAYEAVAGPIRRQMAAALYQEDKSGDELNIRNAVVAIETQVEEKRRSDKGPVQNPNDIDARIALTEHIEEHMFDFPVLPASAGKPGMPGQARLARSK